MSLKRTALVAGLSLSLMLGAPKAEEMVLTLDEVQIEDGDTLLVLIGGQEQRVQLPGIDAPEDGDNPKLERDLARTGLEREQLLVLGRMATEYLRRLTRLAAPFALDDAEAGERDRYGRLLLDLRDSRGESLAEAMLTGGYAMALPQAGERLHGLQAEAQQAQKGLWGLHPEASRLWAGEGTGN